MNLVRYALSIALLVVVWKNSHWSVALSLTLTMVGMEFLTEIVKRIRAALTD